jgi:type IV secretion system protein VirB8
MKADPAVEEYLDGARGWEINTELLKQRVARLSVGFGIAGMVVAVIASLTNLRPPSPVKTAVIVVNETTGVVAQVPTYEGTTDIAWTVTVGYLNQYVIQRERYFYGVAGADYFHTARFNSPEQNKALIATWDRNNPLSPINAYKDGTTVDVSIRGTTRLKVGQVRGQVAQVRFTKRTRVGGGGTEQLTHWIATIEYAYGKPSEDDADRQENLLGLRILDYHRDPEVVAAPAEEPRP